MFKSVKKKADAIKRILANEEDPSAVLEVLKVRAVKEITKFMCSSKRIILESSGIAEGAASASHVFPTAGMSAASLIWWDPG